MNIVRVIIVVVICNLFLVVPGYTLDIAEEYIIDEIYPTCILFHNDHLYLANRYYPALFKVDPNDGSYVIYDLPEGENVRWIYSGIGNNLLLHTQMWENGIEKVVKYNVQDGYAEGGIDLPGNPTDICLIPGSSFGIVVCGMEDTMVVFDYANMVELSTITLEDDPQVIKVNSLGTIAYITHTRGNYVTVWDISGPPSEYEVVSIIQVNIKPCEMALKESDQKLYVCCIEGGTIDIIDTLSNTYIASYYTGVGSYLVSYDSIHDYLWVGRYTDDSRSNAEIIRIRLNPYDMKVFQLPERLIDGKLSGDCTHYIATVGDWDKYNPGFKLWSIDCNSEADNYLNYPEGLLFTEWDDLGNAYAIDVEDNKVLKIIP